MQNADFQIIAGKRTRRLLWTGIILLMVCRVWPAGAFDLVFSPSGEMAPPPNLDSQQPDTLFYDSGGTYYQYGPTNLWGIVRFTAPSDFELRCLYLQMCNLNGVLDGVTVYVHAASGGEPGEMISGPYDFEGPLWLGYSWLDVELDLPYPQLQAGDDFFVIFGPAPMGPVTAGWFLYIDGYGNSDFRSGYSTSPQGPWSFTLSGDLIVRAGGEVADFTDLAVSSCFNDVQRFFLDPGDEVVCQAEIANAGSLPVTDFRVVWRVEDAGGTTVFSDSIDCGSLPEGQSTVVVCPSVWVSGPAGYYTVYATVGSDEDFLNDNDTALLEQGVSITESAWFAYDDGEQNSNVTSSVGTGWGNRFDPPSYPVKVDSLQVAIAGNLDYGDVRLVNLYGVSIDVLWTYSGPLSQGVNTLDLSAQEIYVYCGGVGVGYVYQPGGAIYKDDDFPLAASNLNMPATAYRLAGASWTPTESGDWMLRVFCSETTGMQDPPGSDQPTRFVLHGNHPNPFNAATVISFDLPVESPIDVRVFDAVGRCVGSQNLPLLRAGYHTLRFDASDLVSGVYIYQLTAGDFMTTGKMVLLK